MIDRVVPYPPPLGAHLGIILRDLRASIAHHAARNAAIQPLVAFLWGYLHRAERRLETLLVRWREGRLTVPPRRLRAIPVAATPPRPRKQRFRMPTGRAWLIRRLQPTAQFSSQLEALVARPEMAELLAAAPQAGRILRPLYRMLGIEVPPVLRAPPPSAAIPPPATQPVARPPILPATADPPEPTTEAIPQP